MNRSVSLLKTFLFILLVFNQLIGSAQINLTETVHFQENITSSNYEFSSNLLSEKHILSNYHKLIYEGYFQCSFDTIMHKKDSIEVHYYTGDKYNFTVHFDAVQDQDLMHFLEKNSIDSEQQLSGNIEKVFKPILNYYANSGYPFCRIFFDSLFLENNNLQANVKIEKGKLLKIDSIVIVGYKDLSPAFVKQYLSLSNGMYFQQDKFDEIEERINSLTFIALKSVPNFIQKEGYYILEIPLVKKKANQFDGIIGFRPDPNKSSGVSFNGSVKLELNNAMQQAEQLKLQWYRLEAGSQKAFLTYEMPYLYIVPFGLLAGISFNRLDSNYLNVNQEYGFVFNLNAKQKISALYRYNFTSILSTLERALLSNYLDQNTSLFGIDYQYSKLDNPLNPRKGLSIKINGFGGTSKVIQNGLFPTDYYDTISLQNNHFEFGSSVEYFVPFGKRNTLLFKQVNGLKQKETLYTNELYHLGGFNSIRGFNEDNFLAASFQSLTFEYRWLPDRNSYFSLYTDLAYLMRSKSGNLEPLFAQSFGAGLGINSNAGIFSLQIGIGRTEEQSIALDQTRVHFGYINRF